MGFTLVYRDYRVYKVYRVRRLDCAQREAWRVVLPPGIENLGEGFSVVSYILNPAPRLNTNHPKPQLGFRV